ncbi:MAG: glycoside hydrolase family protein [Phenylobacterium sp.]|jgi:lysozyme|uniref:glycoside hydrolase family protein n=1 Tax=Phenylobacterium sp. TaxID=1871053 RepID=UPI002A369EAF|nr:glycoside hydrolase family protein [Phenylobacterium sp.]MDX9996666.1 glycoside hydrolase family protein [Phenylobacterium sp.]
MKPRHKVSGAAIDLIKRFEGFRERAAQLPDGRWTLGYGHTKTAREGAWVTESDAEALLRYDLIAIADAVNELVFTPLNQNQFDALCAFAFNIGLPAFKTSAVLMLLNEGQPLQAACAMELWRKADFEGERIVVDALVRRRSAEKALFLTPPDGFVPAPTPLLAPHVDADGLGLVPADAPAVIKASLEGETASLAREDAPSAPRADRQPAPEAVAAALAQRMARVFPDKDFEAAFPQSLAPTLPPPEVDAEPLLAAELATDPDPAADVDPEPLPEPEIAFEPAAGEPVAETSAPEPEAETEPVQPSAEAEAPAEGVKAIVLSPPAEAAATEPPAEPLAVAAPEHGAASTWRGKVMGLSALAALGALLLGGGLYWMFNGSAAGVGAPSQTTVGWIVGVAGVLLAGAAFYVLLDMLGRGEEEGGAHGD